MRFARAALLLLLLAPALAWAGEAATRADGETTIWLLRHLEKKVEPGNRDPALTAQGTRRAEALRALLAKVPIDAIYTTPYVRTRKTVEPIALERGIAATELPGGATEELVRRLKESHAGQSVLVAGHSNTVPAIVAGLGVAEPLTMTEADYGDLFLIRLDGRGGVSVVRLTLPD